MTQTAIQVRDLVKTYRPAKGGAPKTALHGISLDVPRGGMFGLLGPNGAGKSTLINILAGLVNKTSGHASIWGFDIDQDPRNAKLSIGVVPQELVFDPFFTPLSMLELQAGLYGVPAADRRSRELLALMGLADKANAYTRQLSGGMRRRLLVAKAMVHAPPILVLDEPTAGVDIELRQQLWSTVRDLHRQGVTVVLTTHYLEEAQELCDRIAIVNHGRIVANAETGSLLASMHEKELVVTVDQDLADIPTDLAAWTVERLSPRRLAITYDRRGQDAGRILEAISAAGLGLTDVSTREANLEDVFLTSWCWARALLA
jgi:ABC-2 type transport system ATP-binding protein